MAAESAPSQAPVAEALELEPDIIRILFSSLDVKELCTVASTCQAWQALANELWPSRAQNRWKRWSSSPRWAELKANNDWRTIYAERHQVGLRLHLHTHRSIS